MSISKKIVLIGHFGVGKTSLIRRFVENTFSEDYKVTIGVHISKKVIEINNTSISFILWDLEGQDDVKKVRASYLLGTNAFVYVFDSSRHSTFKNLHAELNFLKDNYPNIPTKVVGNKMDLITKKHLKIYSDIFDNYVDFFVSAKTGNKVESLFSNLSIDFL